MNEREGVPASLAFFPLLLSEHFTQEPWAFFPMEGEVGLGGKLNHLTVIMGSFSGFTGKSQCAPWP